MPKHRNIGLCIILCIFTCNLYTWYWFMKITDETSEVTGIPGPSGFMSLLYSIFSCGLYDFYWCYKTGEKMDIARHNHGAHSGNLAFFFLGIELFGYTTSGITTFLLGPLSMPLFFYTVITFSLAQNELNKYVPL